MLQKDSLFLWIGEEIMRRKVCLSVVLVLIMLSSCWGCGKKNNREIKVEKVRYQDAQRVLYLKGTVLEPVGDSIEIFVSQYDIEQVKVGQEAEVVLKGKEEIKSKATVQSISDKKQKNGFSVLLELEEKEKYKVGMELSVQLFLKKWNHVFVVKDDVVCNDGKQSYVLVSNDTGTNQKIEKRKIINQEQADEGKVLLSSDVKEGDYVVQNPDDISLNNEFEVKEENATSIKRKFTLKKNDIENMVNFPGIVSLNKNKEKEITGFISQEDILYLKPEMEATIWLNGSVSFKGKITFLSSEIESEGYPYKIEITDKDSNQLKEGENVGIQICVEKKSQVFAVPYDMIYGTDKKYVCKEDGTKIDVKTGCVSDILVEIQSNQLQEGMILVSEN